MTCRQNVTALHRSVTTPVCSFHSDRDSALLPPLLPAQRGNENDPHYALAMFTQNSAAQ